LSSVAAAMFSIGPGFGTVGPAENYAHLPAAAKWTLSACMIAGRLEFFTLVVVLTPGFWRK
jgi:trk system potassium uptake protein TrkH